jgi:hypothetical protein
MKTIVERMVEDPERRLNFFGQLMKEFAANLYTSHINPRATVRSLKDVFKYDAYKEYRHWAVGRKASHKTLTEFVISPSPEGLGMTIEDLRRACAEDKELLDLVDQDIQTARPRGINQHTASKVGCTDSVDAVTNTPHNESSQGILRRLRKDNPELHAKVIDGEMTANAAATKAGYRARRRSISMKDPRSAALTIKNCADNDYISGLIRELLRGD